MSWCRRRGRATVELRPGARAGALAAAAPGGRARAAGLRGAGRGHPAGLERRASAGGCVEDRESFDGAAIEAAAYGSTVAAAAAGRLLERLARGQRDAARGRGGARRRRSVRGGGGRGSAAGARARAASGRTTTSRRSPRRCAPRCSCTATSACSARRATRLRAVAGGVLRPRAAGCSTGARRRMRACARSRSPSRRGSAAAPPSPWSATTWRGVLERVRDDDGAAPGLRGRGARGAVGARRWPTTTRSSPARCSSPIPSTWATSCTGCSRSPASRCSGGAT